MWYQQKTNMQTCQSIIWSEGDLVCLGAVLVKTPPDQIHTFFCLQEQGVPLVCHQSAGHRLLQKDAKRAGALGAFTRPSHARSGQALAVSDLTRVRGKALVELMVVLPALSWGMGPTPIRTLPRPGGLIIYSVLLDQQFQDTLLLITGFSIKMYKALNWEYMYSVQSNSVPQAIKG